jgi:hypothetical protein
MWWCNQMNRINLLLTFAVLSQSACGSPGDETRPSTATIDSVGGQVKSADGQIAVVLPAGAVASSVNVTVQPIESPGAGAVGQVFELGPSGMVFAQPVTLTFHYTAADIGQAQPGELQVATFAAGVWTPVASTVDLASSTVSGQVSHFSPWALVLGGGASKPRDPLGGGGGTSSGTVGGGGGTTGGAGGGITGGSGGDTGGGTAGSGAAGSGGVPTGGVPGGGGTTGGAGGGITGGSSGGYGGVGGNGGTSGGIVGACGQGLACTEPAYCSGSLPDGERYDCKCSAGSLLCSSSGAGGSGATGGSPAPPPTGGSSGAGGSAGTGGIK